jgi:hypothetical protein
MVDLNDELPIDLDIKEKTYEVLIHPRFYRTRVKAINEQEAEEMAIDEYINHDINQFHTEINELEDDEDDG